MQHASFERAICRSLLFAKTRFVLAQDQPAKLALLVSLRVGAAVVRDGGVAALAQPFAVSRVVVSAVAVFVMGLWNALRATPLTVIGSALPEAFRMGASNVPLEGYWGEHAVTNARGRPLEFCGAPVETAEAEPVSALVVAHHATAK